MKFRKMRKSSDHLENACPSVTCSGGIGLPEVAYLNDALVLVRIVDSCDQKEYS
jgi:hypothetical protein